MGVVDTLGLRLELEKCCLTKNENNYTSVTFCYTKAHRHPLTHLGAIKSESLYVSRDFGNQPLKGGTVIASREA